MHQQLHTALLRSLVLALASFGAAQSDPLGVLLTTKGSPTSQIEVVWLDRSATSGDRVWLALADTDEWSRHDGRNAPFGTEPTDLVVHRASLDGLRPGAEYVFKIADAPPVADEGGLHRFRTVPDDPNHPYRFVVGGDMFAMRWMLDAMNAAAGRLDPDLVVLGGDLAYANGVDAERWVAWVESWFHNVRSPDGRLVPFVTAIGNHELRHDRTGRARAPFFFALFRPDGVPTFAPCDIGDHLSFLLLDTDLVVAVDGGQKSWLDAALEQRRGFRHVWPVYHNPAWGTVKPPLGSRDPTASDDARVLHEHWVPLFEQYGVRVAFEHDHHTYKRTWPLRSGRIDVDDGIVYLGDGCWGVDPRAVPDAGDVWYLRRTERLRHLIEIELREGEATYRMRTADGVVFDELPERLPSPRDLAFSIAFGWPSKYHEDLVAALRVDPRSEFAVHAAWDVELTAERAAAVRALDDLPRYVLASEATDGPASDGAPARPWQTRRQAGRPDHFAFVHERVLVVGLTADDRATDWAARSLSESSRDVRAAVVVVSGVHATAPIRACDELFAEFAKPVLVVHGSVRGWHLEHARGSNVWRVGLGRTSGDSPPLRVRVEDHASDPFRFDRHPAKR